MSLEAGAPGLKFAYCPHIEESGEDKTKFMTYAMRDGAIIHVHPERPLVLCPQCWRITKEKVYANLLKEVLQTRKDNLLSMA